VEQARRGLKELATFDRSRMTDAERASADVMQWQLQIGQLEIFRLREKARTALGPRYDIKEFHNVVLSAGSVPLTVLEREVDTYIARKKAA
jgi:uncharacterized protein (DUF885 family)